MQIAEIFKELEKTKFALEPSEKEIGDSVITLLRQNKDPSGLNDISELETFHHAAMTLGIVSSRAVSIEKRGLKRQLDKSRCEEDKRKESIIFYLLHLLRKYNKLFRNSSMDDDSQNLDTCSQSIRNSVEEANLNGRKSDQHESKLHSLDLETRKTAGSSVGMLPGLPEEFRCPISLQLMSDPVIISSGQTYERVCIEKWFSEGHDMCPKTQQKLSYLGVTPNYCVKGLIASWCEKHGIKVPEPPSPPILPLTYWRWDQSGSIKCIDDGRLKRVKVEPLEDPKVTSFDEGDMGRISTPSLVNNNILELPIMHLNRHSVQNNGVDPSMPHDIVDSEKIEDSSRKYERLLANLNTPCLQLQCAAAEEVRILSKDDNEARSYMGANHFIPALVSFLRSAIDASDTKAQETGALALFNIAVNNNR